MKIFSFNEGLNGSYVSRPSGTVSTPTSAPFVRSEKGYAAQFVSASSSKILIPTLVLSRNATSIVVWFKGWDDTDVASAFLLANTTGGYAYIGQSATQLKSESNTNNDYWLNLTVHGIVLTKWYCLIMVADSGTVNSYLQNILVDTETPSDDLTIASIGALTTGANGFDGRIAKVEIYDSSLTVQERAKEYKEFLKAPPRGIELYPKPVLPERKPTDLSRYVDTGLCLAHNMIPSSGNLLVDTSNQNAPSTISGASEILEGLSFDGKDDYGAINLSLALAATVKTICFRIKLASTTEMILDGDNTGSLVIDANAGTLQYPAYDNAFIDGVDTDTIFADQWTDVVITSSTAVDNNTPTLGRTTAAAFTFGKFEIADLQYWSNEWTQEMAAEYHNKWVKPVLGRIPSVYDGIGSISPFGMIQGTGSFSVQEMTAQDAVLKELDIGTKYIRCDVAGTIAVPCTHAYGTLEFYILKGATTVIFIQFIGNNTETYRTNSGYLLYILVNKQFYLAESNGVGGSPTKFNTVTSYILADTWYGITQTNALNGEKTTYIKGGTFGQNYQLVDPTGGSGTNPVTDNTYTTSKYVVADLDVGDCIIIKGWDNGVKQ